MLRYILKRLLIMIPTMLAIIFIIFFIMQFMPNTPGRIILGIKASEEQVIEKNKELGYYDPLPVKYCRYIKNVLKGEFGTSYQSGRPVFEVLLPKFPMTLQLAFFSVLVASVVGVLLGILSAVKRYSAADVLMTVLALFFASIPTFFLGILMMLFFSLRLGILPSSGAGDWKNMVMPVLALALPSAAFISRITRSTMLDTISEDYVMTARAKGCSPMRIIFSHELRNAMMPVVTEVGMTFAALLGGSVIVENVFGLPGFGNIILNAINSQDSPVLMASIIFLSFLFMLVMLVVDVVYALLDPRVTARTMKGGGK